MKMKNTIKSIFIALTVLSVYGYFIMLPSCKNPTDGIIVKINSSIADNTISVQVVDANILSSNIPDPLTFSVTGPDASLVMSSDGTTNFKAVKGVIALILKPGTQPTKIKPIQFNLVAEASGYLKAISPVRINKIGNNNIKFSMVNISNPPQGVSIKQVSLNVPQGGITSPITIDLPPQTGKIETAVVTIPTGTIFKAENGDELYGSLNATFVHFDNRSSASIQSFPGGLTATKVVDINGNAMNPVSFRPLGFTSLEITSGINKVKTFSNPINIAFEINPTTKNPKTNSVYAIGDSIPTSSYNIENGQWNIESTASVSKNTVSNKLEAVVKVPHLSYWNLATYFTGCTSNISALISSSYTFDAIRYMEVLASDNTVLISGYESVLNGINILEQFPSLNDNVTINIYSRGSNEQNKGTIIGSAFFNPCTDAVPTINIIEAPVQAVEIQITGFCPSAREIKPDLEVFYKLSSNKNYNYLGHMVNGFIKTDLLLQNNQYDYKAIYGGTEYSYTRLINQYYYNESMKLSAQDSPCK